MNREPGTHLSRVYCEYFSAVVFCYRLVKKAFLILPYSHHRNSTELGEYLRDLIRLHSKLNAPEILRYLLMPSHKIVFRVFSRTGKSAISDQSGGLPDPLW